MKLLIIDDAYSKVEQIVSLLRGAGIPVERVDQETNAHSARKRLITTSYDLAIVDVNLPDAAGAPATSEGGLNFIRLAMLDSKCLLPQEILFATALDDIASTAATKANALGIPLCHFSATDVSWRDLVLGKARLAQRRSAREVRKVAHIAVITALGSPELDAVLALPLNWRQERFPGDPTLYHYGSLDVHGQAVNVIAASALRKGMAASAALATKMALLFKPKLVAMLGICAGVEGKVQLGDVIVGDPTWDWGSGKNAEDNAGNPVFRLSPIQRPLKSELLTISHEIANSEEFKTRTRGGWTGSFPAGQFGVHIGPMASGASVIADSSTAMTIANQNRDLIAVEMEAFAVMTACEYAATDGLHGIAIKSVCDYADAKKGDDWQSYASYTSAAFAKEIFERYFAAHPEFLV